MTTVQQRIFNTSQQRSFLFEVTTAAKALLLSEGTDARYGARHLKRAIERLLVEFYSKLARLVFMKEYRAAGPQVGERAAAA